MCSGMKATSASFPDFGSLIKSFLVDTSETFRRSTSPMRSPQRACNSSISLYLKLDALKISSSTVSLSRIFLCTREADLKVFDRREELQGFWIFEPAKSSAKPKKAL